MKIGDEIENLLTNMEENNNSDKHGTHWNMNILCVCQKTDRK